MGNDEVVNMIMSYEQGELSHDETILLFQHLVDTDMIHQLQGHYGRTAASLIKAGYIHKASEK